MIPIDNKWVLDKKQDKVGKHDKVQGDKTILNSAVTVRHTMACAAWPILVLCV
jgi:hypothetical protein